MKSRFGIEVEVLERALKNMVEGGYLGMESTVEDLEDMAYSCCEGLEWYAKKKLYEWADS